MQRHVMCGETARGIHPIQFEHLSVESTQPVNGKSEFYTEKTSCYYSNKIALEK